MGEDAYYFRHDSLGVADGVGGWCSVKSISCPLIFLEADPALFSRRLLHYISLELDKYDDIVNEDISTVDYYNIDPRKIIQLGLNSLLEETQDKILGSTTVLITILRVSLNAFIVRKIDLKSQILEILDYY